MKCFALIWSWRWRILTGAKADDRHSIRSRVEHVFADQKSQTGLVVRTVGIARATMRIGLANIVCNMRRFLFLEQISASA
ncbi:MAG: hypothetical protein ABF876_01510 [Acetobacter aceti]|uniref:Transposase IS4-like domain-containing protein n=1 Tax=Acetobacter aceti TaxID=435 RepID=A0A1U9KH91_ACEAC|nr:hypothetical protein [Acetobacter aceti]AQS85173.1 hypothetical protein A0U92_10685 [Acetobacter aceti]